MIIETFYDFLPSFGKDRPYFDVYSLQSIIIVVQFFTPITYDEAPFLGKNDT